MYTEVYMIVDVAIIRPSQPFCDKKLGGPEDEAIVLYSQDFILGSCLSCLELPGSYAHNIMPVCI